MQQRVYRMAVLATTKKNQGLLPVAPATIWRWVNNGTFPHPFKLGLNTTVWSADAVDAWVDANKGTAAHKKTLPTRKGAQQ
jgi:predicted DNA-binding transcriptional regulator AlpA